MKNLLFTLRYDGTDYHGWQVQENANTVQQTFQDAAERICGVRDNVIGCSRTDSGVHADMYCCNMRTESSLSPEKWKSAMNGVLPHDIAVTDCREVPFEFHARLTAPASDMSTESGTRRSAILLFRDILITINIRSTRIS